MYDMYKLKLFVCGTTGKTEESIARLKVLLWDNLAGNYSLEIVDILDNLKLAETERILATPTLIKQTPPPIRRIVGDMTDTEKVLLGLDVKPYSLFNNSAG